MEYLDLTDWIVSIGLDEFQTIDKQRQFYNKLNNIMQRKNIIILISDNKPIARGNFKKLCLEYDLPYHSLKMLKFPIEYKDCIIHKVEFK